jgi:hypothetical protein
MANVQVRKLTVTDALNVAEIIDQTLETMGTDELIKMMSGNSTKEVGVKLMKAALKQSRTSVLSFLADVNNMKTEEFLELDAEAIPKTIQSILNDPRNSGFFEQLRGLLPSVHSQ